MRYLSLFPIALICLASPLFAASDCSDPENTSYQCYLENVSTHCDQTVGLWKKENFLMTTLPATRYPELTVQGFQATDRYIESYQSRGQEPSSSENYSFLFLQKAHNLYHRDMNAIYNCAMLSARIDITQKILDTINARYGNRASEIVRSIENRHRQMTALLPSGCNGMNSNQTAPLRLRLLDSSSYQYCTYRYYLDYMKKNVDKDFSHIQLEISKYQKQQQWVETPAPTDTAQFAAVLASRDREIEYEVEAARRTYPVALAAFVEMDRTYSVHLLLEFIYDDYVELRSNLRDFLNPMSQLFYKVLNAQSANR